MDHYVNRLTTELAQIPEIDDARKLAIWTQQHYTPEKPNDKDTNLCHVLISEYELDEEYQQKWFRYPILFYRDPQPTGLGKGVNAVSIVLSNVNVNENMMHCIINTIGSCTRSLFIESCTISKKAIQLLAKFLSSDNCPIWFLRIWIEYEFAPILTPIYRAWRHNKSLKGLELPNYFADEEEVILSQKPNLIYLAMSGLQNPMVFFKNLRNDMSLKHLHLRNFLAIDIKIIDYYFDFLRENNCLETYFLEIVPRDFNIELLTECLKVNRKLRQLNIELSYSRNKLSDETKAKLNNMAIELKKYNKVLSVIKINVVDDKEYKYNINA